MVNLETNEDEGPYEGIGGSESVVFDAGSSSDKSHKDQVRAMHRSLDHLDQEIALGQQDKTDLLKFLEDQKMLLASTPSIWPTKGWLSSGFGYRRSPFTGEKEFHKGIDISTRIKSTIVAPANGIVKYVGRDHGYGNMVAINHGYGLVTRYAHLHKALVKKHQHVKRGEPIALVGNTGRSTGPHLHYEVILNKVPVNPLRYILN
jgi:murein DD-endopeptidase MepM/ murein hydrolase activator NlpD